MSEGTASKKREEEEDSEEEEDDEYVPSDGDDSEADDGTSPAIPFPVFFAHCLALKENPRLKSERAQYFTLFFATAMVS